MILKKPDSVVSAYKTPSSGLTLFVLGAIALLVGIVLIAMNQTFLGCYSIGAGISCLISAQVVDLLGQMAHESKETNRQLALLAARLQNWVDRQPANIP